MKPLIDQDKQIFNRGKHEGKFIDHVARIDIDYVIWIVRESDTDEGSREYLAEYLMAALGIEI